MTHEDWARRVDTLIVEHAPTLLYALRGRGSRNDYHGIPVEAEHFKTPHWQTIHGFVVIYEQPDDKQGVASQGRASYMPTTLGAARPGERITARNRTRYYSRDERGARVAASEIAAFLENGVMPPANLAEF